MNHTRFPKEDHLPNWERRDNKVTKGEYVEHVHGQEEKNDQMVPQTFQKATELYSSQFVCCLPTSDRKKYTAALI